MAPSNGLDTNDLSTVFSEVKKELGVVESRHWRRFERGGCGTLGERRLARDKEAPSEGLHSFQNSEIIFI
jgi:hypothetical protein